MKIYINNFKLVESLFLNMTGQNDVNAQEIIDKMYNIRDEATWGFQVAYCRGLDYKGDPDYHHFLAYSDDILSSQFITGFNEIIEEYDPKRVELSTTREHPHLTIGFRDERINNYPPDPNGKYEYESLEVRARDGECVRCRRKTPESYPNLTIKEDNTKSKWDTNLDTQQIDLCTNCSPAHYDDMTRLINAICVENGRVVAVDYGEGDIKTVNDSDFNKVVTEAMVKILERDIL
jgi:hypothetical protein